MKQLTTAIALTCALATPLSFAETTESSACAKSFAPITVDFSATAEQPTVIPIDANGRDATVAITVSHDYYCLDNKCDNARVQVTWNDEVVAGGECITPGSSAIFHVKGNGTLMIKNLTTDGYTSPWDNQFYPSVAYGYITINIE